MKTQVILGLVLASLALTGCAPRQQEAARFSAEDEWKSLFNGEDLSGWRVPVGDGGHWKVVDGVIDYDALSEADGEKHLWTEQSFGDFTLHVDWRIKGAAGIHTMRLIEPDGSYKRDEEGEVVTLRRPNADSGILLRGDPHVQANIWNWPVGSGEVYRYRTSEEMPPEVRAGVTPRVRADRPMGEWNTFVITMRGDRLTVELNGTTVIEEAQLPGVPEHGPIGLQHHGGIRDGKLLPTSSLVQFRNIYVREL